MQQKTQTLSYKNIVSRPSRLKFGVKVSKNYGEPQILAWKIFLIKAQIKNNFRMHFGQSAGGNLKKSWNKIKNIEPWRKFTYLYKKEYAFYWMIATSYVHIAFEVKKRASAAHTETECMITTKESWLTGGSTLQVVTGTTCYLALLFFCFFFLLNFSHPAILDSLCNFQSLCGKENYSYSYS